jgi:hypothetical protein
MARPFETNWASCSGELNRPGYLDTSDIPGASGEGRIAGEPVSHQCPKTRSDTIDETAQMRHAKRPDQYLCDTVEQQFTHLSSLGVKWSQVQILSARHREVVFELRRFVVPDVDGPGPWDQFGTTTRRRSRSSGRPSSTPRLGRECRRNTAGPYRPKAPALNRQRNRHESGYPARVSEDLLSGRRGKISANHSHT